MDNTVPENNRRIINDQTKAAFLCKDPVHTTHTSDKRITTRVSAVCVLYFTLYTYKIHQNLSVIILKLATHGEQASKSQNLVKNGSEFKLWPHYTKRYACRQAATGSLDRKCAQTPHSQYSTLVAAALMVGVGLPAPSMLPGAVDGTVPH